MQKKTTLLIKEDGTVLGSSTRQIPKDCNVLSYLRASGPTVLNCAISQAISKGVGHVHYDAKYGGQFSARTATVSSNFDGTFLVRSRPDQTRKNIIRYSDFKESRRPCKMGGGK